MVSSLFPLSNHYQTERERQRKSDAESPKPPSTPMKISELKLTDPKIRKSKRETKTPANAPLGSGKKEEGKLKRDQFYSETPPQRM